MKYIYIDESGDLGNKYSSSRYFVFAAVMVSNPKRLDNLIKNTYRKHKNIRKMNEIKGTTTPANVKKDIFKRLNNIDYHAFIVVFDKQNMYKIDYDHNTNLLYDILASQLAKIISIDEKTVIFVDKVKIRLKVLTHYLMTIWLI